MDFKDYYTTLGVPKDATDADIKKAYRTLARKFHPDVNPGDKTAEAHFKEINEANEVLGDPEKRRKYDELGANWRQYEHAQNAGADGDWAANFGSGFGGGTSYRTMTPEEMEVMFGGQDPFSDFFHTFFGAEGPTRTSGRAGRSSRSRTANRAGQDLEQPIDLTLEEAFAGTTRRMVIREGKSDRTVEVRIPAGVKDGARVRAANEGGPGARGGKRGDLYLIVRLLPHARFERRGQDLYARADVPVTTAVLGGDASVETLSGSTLRLKVPELTRNGRVFRLRGHGMPAVGRPDERGDLYATIEVQVPQELTEEQRALYAQLKALEKS